MLTPLTPSSLCRRKKETLLAKFNPPPPEEGSYHPWDRPRAKAMLVFSLAMSPSLYSTSVYERMKA